MQQTKSWLLHSGRVLGWGIAVLLVWKLGFTWGSLIGSAVSLGILAGCKKMQWGNPFISGLKDGTGVSIVLALVIFACKLFGAALSVITTIVWGIFIVFVLLGLLALWAQLKGGKSDNL